jgi:hypothetical protein
MSYEPGAEENPPLFYFVPDPEGVYAVSIVDGDAHRVFWTKKEALNRCRDLLQFIAEIRE